MVKKMPYKDLTQVMKFVKIQILESIPFACEVCPDFPNDSPEKLFNWLKSWVRYKNDPAGVELLQTMQTMYRKGGWGDCDCFTITTVACMVACGYKKIDVILVGRKPTNAVHIYTQCVVNGVRYTFDLTNRNFNTERSYPYKQTLKFKI